jgi:hypothetical protein
MIVVLVMSSGEFVLFVDEEEFKTVRFRVFLEIIVIARKTINGGEISAVYDENTGICFAEVQGSERSILLLSAGVKNS